MKIMKRQYKTFYITSIIIATIMGFNLLDTSPQAPMGLLVVAIVLPYLYCLFTPSFGLLIPSVVLFLGVPMLMPLFASVDNPTAKLILVFVFKGLMNTVSAWFSGLIAHGISRHRRKKLKTIEADPAAKLQLEAETLYRKASKLEARANVEGAVALYEQIISQYSDTEEAQDAEVALKSLRAKMET